MWLVQLLQIFKISFEYKGESCVKCTSRTLLKTGDTYYMDHDDFHSTINFDPHNITVTLFIRTNQMKAGDIIFEKNTF